MRNREVRGIEVLSCTALQPLFQRRVAQCLAQRQRASGGIDRRVGRAKTAKRCDQ